MNKAISVAVLVEKTMFHTNNPLYGDVYNRNFWEAKYLGQFMVEAFVNEDYESAMKIQARIGV